ncbi:MAG: sterol desaturase family protein [Acidobacteria bacterium]|nr:sterol desaturase family protein [Acidobacteriota bacterium]
MLDLLQSSKFIVVIAFVLLWVLERVFPAASDNALRLRHDFRNLTLGAINAGLSALLLASLLVFTAKWTATSQIGLLNKLSVSPLLSTLLAIILLDGWMYCWHRANHVVPFLWRFHRVHHSDLEMDASTAIRFHAGEIVMSGLLRVALIPMLGLSLKHLLLYDALLLPVILFHHSNVNLPERLDRWLRLLITTPALHRVHHSRRMIEANSNYGSIFSFWDRLWRTFQLRSDGSPVDFGVKGLDSESQQTIRGLLQVPFTNASSATTAWTPAAPVPAKSPRLR